MPYFRHITGEVYEIRIISGHDSFKILCFFTHNKEIILTNGFRKITLKTPKKGYMNSKGTMQDDKI